jgi:hypothetical protein
MGMPAEDEEAGEDIAEAAKYDDKERYFLPTHFLFLFLFSCLKCKRLFYDVGRCKANI